jgi:hypothetical protein
MSSYSAVIKKVHELNDDVRKRVVDLYLDYYDGSSREIVLSDIKNKSEIVILYYHGQLVGFTTYQIYRYSWNSQPLRIVYSGDTVVEKAHWGQQALSFAWMSRMGELKREEPDKPLYWFIIVKGHRTYKYLPIVSKSFYPHWSNHCFDLKLLLDNLATERFGSYYNKETGVISFPVSRGHLKDKYAYPSREELKKDSVKYFMAKNPGYVRGNELACLCELEEENMNSFVRRIFSKNRESADVQLESVP